MFTTTTTQSRRCLMLCIPTRLLGTMTVHHKPFVMIQEQRSRHTEPFVHQRLDEHDRWLMRGDHMKVINDSNLVDTTSRVIREWRIHRAHHCEAQHRSCCRLSMTALSASTHSVQEYGSSRNKSVLHGSSQRRDNRRCRHWHKTRTRTSVHTQDCFWSLA